MKLKPLLTVASLTAIVAATTFSPAHAQTATVTSLGGTYTYTVTESVTHSGSIYTYNYLTQLTAVNPLPAGSIDVDTFSFNFQGPYFTATAVGTGSPTPAFTPLLVDPANGYSVFSATATGNGLQNTGQTVTFTFTSPNAPGGRLALNNTSENGDASSVTGLNSKLTGPMAAPEPSSLVAMAVLTGCLALGITARRRASGAA